MGTGAGMSLRGHKGFLGRAAGKLSLYMAQEIVINISKYVSGHFDLPCGFFPAPAKGRKALIGCGCAGQAGSGRMMIEAYRSFRRVPLSAGQMGNDWCGAVMPEQN